ncbi:hypothetical protein [Xanthomonas sp. 3058]|uniref:hypothetical protein n=1 Tax=Xanthomonas sp. 3058 TaxID=3035314 RepID=UPI00161A9795|nr:hypothetical protein [Xanthomonas sp. 3058]MBB5866209.1 hypothetical protein [Xanthomonas sp. 3058]
MKDLFGIFHNSSTRPALPTGFAYLDGVAAFRSSVQNTVSTCLQSSAAITTTQTGGQRCPPVCVFLRRSRNVCCDLPAAQASAANPGLRKACAAPQPSHAQAPRRGNFSRCITLFALRAA